MRPDKILALIGLATKAGKTVSGEFSTEKAVKTGTARVVVVSEESSANTKKRFQNMCTCYEVPIYFYGAKEALGSVCGKEFRASLAVTDAGLADAIKKEFKNEEERR